MPRERHWWSLLAFITATLLVGLPYWSIPYSKLTLAAALASWSLVAVGALALALVATGQARFWRALLVTAGAVPMAIMLRVVVDGIQDPSAHNLWPAELGFGIVRALPYAVLGAVVGWLLRRGRISKAASLS